MSEFKDLEHRLVKNVTGLEVGSDEVRFLMDDGTRYIMHHVQDCCEVVRLEEIVGDVPADWDGVYIGRAEQSSEAGTSTGDGSSTWTFYRVDTTRGCFVLRWLGESNGFYSEEVKFEQEDT